ncbi:response regulator transcription factor [Phaeobacter gallaeciensis]|uniref:response regulator transcription factor n=1 Tax=Phaeobacter gallaeciensis TaxID=60890 RepID=UPI00237F55AD|nr:response regulator transcription factor [Phaeobacter gallaeciensis]MDE4247601.1 response regulator transcription factor [Phaeobacter gallaeciensis]MDE4408735.1 response regulator transcription factor [Phaeobacter gallaeciensis]
MVSQTLVGADTKTILVADDHAVLCDALATVFENQGCAVYKSHDKNGLCELLDHHGPDIFDIILLDVNMPGMLGLKSIKEVCRSAKPTPVALMSSGLTYQFVRDALKLGVSGYIPKTTHLNSFKSVMDLIVSGGIYIPTDLIVHEDGMDNPWNLTPREQSIAAFVSKGMSNKIIAYELEMSEPTVKMHLRSIFKKMKATNRTQVAFAIREAGLQV